MRICGWGGGPRGIYLFSNAPELRGASEVHIGHKKALGGRQRNICAIAPKASQSIFGWFGRGAPLARSPEQPSHFFLSGIQRAFGGFKGGLQGRLEGAGHNRLGPLSQLNRLVSILL